MKILIALSGGIDSSVTAALLKKQGHQLIGIHLKFWNENFQPKGESLPENKCCSLSALESARSVAAKLDIPFYVLNFREPFYKHVVKNFLKTYASGETPNPCVICNREIKFGHLVKKMHELGYDKIATGHFARISKTGNTYNLQRGKDKAKDQSYFLSNLTQAKLKHTLFPLGNKTKPEVRELAKNFGFEKKLSTKKESQGTCFFPEKEPQNFLMRNLPKSALKSGPIKTLERKTVGQHKGLSLYTIGQRRGVDLGGMSEPYYVAGFDRKNNILLVGPNSQLFNKALKAKNLNWISKSPKSDTKILAQIRYRSPAEPARITLKKTIAIVEFTKPQRAITPGQTIAFYEGQTCLGSGIIY